ncbi:MAG: PilZ domain-containing protein [Bryobacteraceae bacterium]
MPDQRKNQRFDLRLPVELIRSGPNTVERSGETVNLSSGGVLFHSDLPVEIGQPIEFMITLPTGNKGTAVRLKCVGKVVRTEAAESSSVAATLERFEFVRVAKARAS